MKAAATLAGALAVAAIASVSAQESKSIALSTGLEVRTVKGAPYSGDTSIDSLQVLSDGNRISRHVTGRVYRDSEGRTRREENRPNGTSSITISDPVAGVSYTLDAVNHVAWKTPGTVALNIVEGAVNIRKIEEARVQALQAIEGREAVPALPPGALFLPPPGGGRDGGPGELRRELRNVVTQTLTPKPIEGVMCDGRRTTITIPAGAMGNDQPIAITSEEWTSPDLRVLVLTDHTDPRTGENTYKLTNIVRGDPDPSLFQVPVDYTIRESRVRRFEPQPPQ
jgi:hypothetical protein